jgi:hypothetical protein
MLISLAFRTWAFQPVQKTATIHVSSGFIWGIPAEVLMAAARLWNICRILGRERMKGHKEKPQEEIPEFISKLLSTDFRLRCGMGGLALLLPPLLIGWSLITGFDVLPSMSHYYFASPTLYPMRTWFVGVLFTLGFFLIFYRGFSRVESILLSILGVCAMAVAIVHMTPDPKYCIINKVDVCGGPAVLWWPWAHAFFAVFVFLAMAAIVFLCSQQTLAELNEQRLKWYRRIYHGIGVAMVVGPLLVVFAVEPLWPVSLGKFQWRVLALETIGVFLFGSYWLVKTREISETGADKKAAMGKLKSPPTAPWLKRVRLDRAVDRLHPWPKQDQPGNQ